MGFPSHEVVVAHIRFEREIEDSMATPGRPRGSSQLSFSEQKLINNVHEFFCEEKRRNGRILANEPGRRTAEACGVGRRTVFNAIKAVAEGSK